MSLEDGLERWLEYSVRWRDPKSGEWKIVVTQTIWSILEKSGWDMSRYVIGKPLPTQVSAPAPTSQD